MIQCKQTQRGRNMSVMAVGQKRGQQAAWREGLRQMLMRQPLSHPMKLQCPNRSRVRNQQTIHKSGDSLPICEFVGGL